MQASFPLSLDGDVVDLVYSLAVRGSPGGLVDFLVGEDGAPSDQVKLCEKCTVFVLFSGAMSAHDQFSVGVVCSHFSVEVSHEDLQISLVFCP